MKRIANTRPSLGQLLANDGADFKTDSGGHLPKNEIHLANEARFTQEFYSEPLTEYLVGWKDPNNIEQTLENVAPSVQVPRRFEFKMADNSEAFLAEFDDVRAIGSDFKRVEYSGTTVNQKTINKGLTVRIDLDEQPDIAMAAELATARLTQRILRNELIRALTALGAAATNVAKTWDGSTGKDPDADLAAQLIAGSDASGVQPNRVLFGSTSWQKRFLSLRSVNVPGGYTSSTLTTEQLQQLLGVDMLTISNERYQLAKTASKSQMVGALVFLYYALSGAGKDDPSNIKRFFTPANGGGKFRAYQQQVSAKLIDISVEHYSNVIVTSTLGIRQITVS